MVDTNINRVDNCRLLRRKEKGFMFHRTGAIHPNCDEIKFIRMLMGKTMETVKLRYWRGGGGGVECAYMNENPGIVDFNGKRDAAASNRDY